MRRRKGIFNQIRYSYWIVIALLRKHIMLVLTSFLITMFVAISLTSLFPYMVGFMNTQRHVIGYAGSYTTSDLPPIILEKISNGLIAVNNEGMMMRALAERWEVLDEGREYRFYLRQELYWNDGAKFNTDNITYSFKDVRTVILDKHIISFQLNDPVPIFPTYLTKPITKDGYIGVAGLYRIDNMKIRNGIVKEVSLAPNKDDLMPEVWRFYATDTELLTAYKLGEIDSFRSDKENIANLFTHWENTTIEKHIDHSQILTLFVNMQNPMFQDKDMRQALAMITNKDAFSDKGVSVYGPIPRTSWAYYPDIKKIMYNPEVGRKILEVDPEVSTDTPRLRLHTYFDHLGVANDIQASLESVGYDIDIKIENVGVPDEFDLFLATLQVSENDPDQYFFWHSTQQGNITHYNRPRVDKLLEDGRSTGNTEERKEIYEDFQRVFVDDPPVVFLYHPYIYEVRRTKVS